VCPLSVQAGLHRGLGELSAAIDVLRHYLDHYSNDKDAWEELADCYLEVRGGGWGRGVLVVGQGWGVGGLWWEVKACRGLPQGARGEG